MFRSSLWSPRYFLWSACFFFIPIVILFCYLGACVIREQSCMSKWRSIQTSETASKFGIDLHHTSLTMNKHLRKRKERPFLNRWRLDSHRCRRLIPINLHPLLLITPVTCNSLQLVTLLRYVLPSVGVPDPDPQSACFWASQLQIHYLEVRIRILPFSHKGVERSEIMLAIT